MVRWQCKQCGGIQNLPEGARPPVGGFCGKSADHKHKWSKAAAGPTRWKCKECGCSQTTQGLRPSVGSFCGKSKDHKHKWVKI